MADISNSKFKCKFWMATLPIKTLQKTDLKSSWYVIVLAVVAFQRTTYVWQQPLQCFGGVSLPAQKVSACVSLDAWLKFGVSTGTIGAALLIGVSCYFWKKTRKWVFKSFLLLCGLKLIQNCSRQPESRKDETLFELTRRPSCPLLPQAAV